jgi:23S rRNA (cytosine1962-C5)-methyltransferase
MPNQSPKSSTRSASPAPPAPAASWQRPWVQLRTFSYSPTLYPAMLKAASPDARPGSLVAVYDKNGSHFGTGLYHPKARVPLRVLRHGPGPVGEELFPTLLDRALDLRLRMLDLPAQADAFRAVHSDGDNLSGLIIDRYADVLSIECHSLGMFQRLPAWLPHLHERLGTKRVVLDVDPAIARMEGIFPKQLPTDAVRSVRIREHGIRYEVDFAEGHKTGFFCDQRENRRRFGRLAKGRRVLDLCCYTGGFALSAKVAGGCEDVTGVDLDEKAIAQARRNANLNQARIEWVHCDAFSYARQMQQNGRRWDAVVLDPPKLMLSREEAHEGYRKYEDLNHLAMTLVEPGGLFVTCSCSGLLAAEAFEETLVRLAHRESRRLQILDRTGPGADHPVMSTAPEGRYLKLIWTRVY